MQRIAEAIGDSGCYFLVVMRAGELYTRTGQDALRLFELGLDKGWIGDDCYLIHPELILEHITGVKWEMRKEGVDYIPVDGEIVILRYERNMTWGSLIHFVLADKDGKTIIYDPWDGCKTVKLGKLMSKHVYKQLN